MSCKGGVGEAPTEKPTHVYDSNRNAIALRASHEEVDMSNRKPKILTRTRSQAHAKYTSTGRSIRGVSDEQATERDEQLPPQSGIILGTATPEQLHALFESWQTDDAEEQRETLEYLKRALDEDRLSNRPLFPKRDTTQ
jgi:hypothetical protein